jgi:hypothetical protein
VIVGEGEADGDGDGLGDGDGDGFVEGFGEAEVEAEVGGDTGSGVVDAPGAPGVAFFAFLSFGDADSDGDPEDAGGCSVTRCTAASG